MSKKPGFGFAGFSLSQQAKKPLPKAFSEEDDDGDDTDNLDGEAVKEPEPAAKQVFSHFSTLVIDQH
jgi:hypothetical protein